MRVTEAVAAALSCSRARVVLRSHARHLSLLQSRCCAACADRSLAARSLVACRCARRRPRCAIDAVSSNSGARCCCCCNECLGERRRDNDARESRCLFSRCLCCCSCSLPFDRWMASKCVSVHVCACVCVASASVGVVIDAHCPACTSTACMYACVLVPAKVRSTRLASAPATAIGSWCNHELQSVLVREQVVAGAIGTRTRGAAERATHTPNFLLMQTQTRRHTHTHTHTHTHSRRQSKSSISCRRQGVPCSFCLSHLDCAPCVCCSALLS